MRALDTVRVPEQLIHTEWDKHVKYNEQTLIEAGILGAPIAEGGMTNITQLQRLHNGAIWQLYTKQQEALEQNHRLQSRITKLERLLAA